MSLRVRLILSIALVVMLATVALSILHLDTLANSISKDALDRANLAGQQAKSFIDNFINQNSSKFEAPVDPQGVIAVWNNLITSDPEVSSRLLEIMAPSPAILEINVAGQTREVLASSNPSRLSGPLPELPMFTGWRDSGLKRRMVELFVHRPDYQVQVPLGQIATADTVPHTIFTIQVVTSSVLLRAALLPDVEWLAAVSGGAVLASLLLTAFAANWILQPLRRIERTIDRMVQGNYGTQENPVAMAKEFAVVQSKLSILGEQYRGAQEAASEKQHSLDQRLERMASQFDVAARLAAISRISGGVAHEIKNPLNAISLRLDLLRERLGAPEEELRPEIDILSNEVRRLDRVVKTFLDFTRPVEVKFEEVDLAALAHEVADLMTPQARSSHIAVAFESESQPANIRGDADMLKQAVLNLVTNALDAMTNAHKSQATADAGELRLRVSNSGDSVKLEVADNGPGIPANVRDKVFQLYFTTKQRGSGIGLAMTYRAVQLHNGTIDFTSEDGCGTTFSLQFPALVGNA
jgi:signal transduction histidine kinase